MYRYEQSIFINFWKHFEQKPFLSTNTDYAGLKKKKKNKPHLYPSDQYNILPLYYR